MWIFWLVAIILFYLLAIMQTSFFAHFLFFGAFPNFIFIFFFLLVFYAPRKSEYKILVYAIIAGLFLDIFYETNFGVSIVLLMLAGYIAKKIQLSLLEKSEKYPYWYFIFLFIFSFILYQSFFILYIKFLNPLHISVQLNLKSLADLAYNAFFASIGFYIYKKIVKVEIPDNQLKLFR